MQRSYFIRSIESRGYKKDDAPDYVGRVIYRRGSWAVLFGETKSQLITVINAATKDTFKFSEWKQAHEFLKNEGVKTDDNNGGTGKQKGTKNRS